MSATCKPANDTSLRGVDADPRRSGLPGQLLFAAAFLFQARLFGEPLIHGRSVRSCIENEGVGALAVDIDRHGVVPVFAEAERDAGARPRRGGGG